MTSADTIAPVAGTYRHPDFGEVQVRTRSNSRTLRAFWRDSSLIVSIPTWCTRPDLLHFLDAARERLIRARVTRFHPGMIIDAGESDITVTAGAPAQKQKIMITVSRTDTFRGKQLNFTIRLNAAMIEDISEASVQKAVNRAVKSCAMAATREFVVPMAEECAAEVGRRPGMWIVKDSVRALGRCNSRGVIQLSPRLVFLPRDLRRFVIFHELAHLSEMNHSQAFHELCDSYMGGREQECHRRLRSFRFPID